MAVADSIDDSEHIREQFLETVQPGAARRHHVVPQFLLRNFANEADELAMRRAEAPQDTRIARASNLAVSNDFYMWVDQENRLVVGLENMLGRIESDAAPAIRRLASVDPVLRLPPSDRERVLLARFVAMQFVRTPRHRRVQEALVDFVWKLDFEHIETADDIRSRFRANGHDPSEDEVEMVAEMIEDLDNYRAVAHQNDHIQSMLDVAYHATVLLLQRHMSVLMFESPGLAMSDDPVLLIGGTAPSGGAPGLETCELVGLPISRDVALIFHHEPTVPPFVTSEWTAAQWNERTAAMGALELYFHPDDAPAVPTEFQTLEQPLLMVDSSDGPGTTTTDGINSPPVRTIRPDRSKGLLDWNFEHDSKQED